MNQELIDEFNKALEAGWIGGAPSQHLQAPIKVESIGLFACEADFQDSCALTEYWTKKVKKRVPRKLKKKLKKQNNGLI